MNGQKLRMTKPGRHKLMELGKAWWNGNRHKGRRPTTCQAESQEGVPSACSLENSFYLKPCYDLSRVLRLESIFEFKDRGATDIGCRRIPGKSGRRATRRSEKLVPALRFAVQIAPHFVSSSPWNCQGFVLPRLERFSLASLRPGKVVTGSRVDSRRSSDFNTASSGHDNHFSFSRRSSSNAGRRHAWPRDNHRSLFVCAYRH